MTKITTVRPLTALKTAQDAYADGTVAGPFIPWSPDVKPLDYGKERAFVRSVIERLEGLLNQTNDPAKQIGYLEQLVRARKTLKALQVRVAA